MEITLSLSAQKKGNKTVLVYTISLAYRILMGIIFLLIAGAVLSSLPISISGLLITVLCFFALLYEETWIFDNESGIVTYYFGLMILRKKRIFAFDAIESLSINHFARGKLNQETLPAPEKMPFGSQTRLILNLKNSKPVLINTTSFSRRKKIIDDAETISEYTHIALNFEN